jgi:hypothetical protein
VDPEEALKELRESLKVRRGTSVINLQIINK